MVKAILENRKSVTRRVIKPQPPTEFEGSKLELVKCEHPDFIRFENKTAMWTHKLPYKPGYILWVRETTYLFGKWVRNGVTRTGKQKYKFVWDKSKPVIYAADGKPDYICKDKNEVGYFKRPSIFMPREAARISHNVKNIRVERIQDITAEDARAEGISETDVLKAYNAIFKHKGGFADNVASRELTKLFGTDNEYIYEFRNLWNSINAKRGYGWDANPFVWVIEFERCEVTQ
jgi:hypothetical protein